MCWRAYGSVIVGLLLACPANLAHSAPQPAGASQSTATTVRALLDIGLKDGPEALTKSRRHWAQNRMAALRDARVDFAWGLILRKHGKNREAERQFLTASGRTNPKYLPARQAVVWMKFATGDMKSGLLQLEALFREVVSGRGVTEDDRIASARWIGRVTAALKKRTLSKRDAKKVESLQSRAERLLKGRLTEAYKAGIEDLAKRAKEIESEALKKRLASRKRKTKQTAARKKKLAGRKTAIGKQKAALQRSAKQWREWLESQEKAAKSVLQKHMNELRILDSRRQAVSRSMNLVSQEWREVARGRVTGPLGRVAIKQEQLRLEQKYLGYYKNYLATVAAMHRVRKSALVVMGQYRQTVKQYEAGTGKLARKSKTLDAWQKTLKQQEQTLKTKPPAAAPGKGPLIAQNSSLSPYVYFDVGRERERLLKSLSNGKTP